MKILGLNRVELLLPPDQLDEAVRVFNDVLGADFDPPELLTEHQVLSTTDFEVGLELFGPGGPDSALHASLARKGVGAIGPIVWEVEDLDEAKRELVGKGYAIYFEYENAEKGIRQLCLDPAEMFGYTITFMQRTRS